MNNLQSYGFMYSYLILMIFKYILLIDNLNSYMDSSISLKYK